jgi:hypothetical protein
MPRGVFPVGQFRILCLALLSLLSPSTVILKHIEGDRRRREEEVRAHPCSLQDSQCQPLLQSFAPNKSNLPPGTTQRPQPACECESGQCVANGD